MLTDPEAVPPATALSVMLDGVKAIFALGDVELQADTATSTAPIVATQVRRCLDLGESG
jgi:hypothetical protein